MFTTQLTTTIYCSLIVRYNDTTSGGRGIFKSNQSGADLGGDSADTLLPFWLVVIWLFARLQNTSIKHVNHQKEWWLFSKRIGINSKEKKEWVVNRGKFLRPPFLKILDRPLPEVQTKVIRCHHEDESFPQCTSLWLGGQPKLCENHCY